MRNKRISGLMVLLVAFLIVGFVFVDGCKKEPSPSPTPAASAATEQTTCPVMGGSINKDIFVEYQGKKVYFCCAECKAIFEKEPEKYLSKLPQFAK
jgi:YHS domain-containing protein